MFERITSPIFPVFYPCAKLLHYQTQSVSCNKGPEITVIMIFQEQYQHSDIRVAIRQEMLTSSQL